MTALITGASSGIGRDMARVLAEKGHDLILTARRLEPMEKLKSELESKFKINIEIITQDLSTSEGCFALYEKIKGKQIDILINNAGFGVFGAFSETPLDRELEMIDTNVVAVHILTKLILADMKARDSGYILNVASSAAFLPGPLFSSYYASKAYILRLTQSVGYELKKEGSKVYLGALCPGPVATEFDKVANVSFSNKSLSSEFVAKYAIEQMFNRKKVIIPGTAMRLGKFGMRFLPDEILMKITYNIQHKKYGK